MQNGNWSANDTLLFVFGLEVEANKGQGISDHLIQVGLVRVEGPRGMLDDSIPGEAFEELPDQI